MKKFGLMLISAAMLASSPAWAGSSQLGDVTTTGALPNGMFYFYLSTGHDGAPPCQGTNAVVAPRWAVDANTAGGQTVIASILTAFAAHKKVYVSGLGACTVMGDAETVGVVETSG